MLWEMTFAQLLTLVETRNARELKAHEEAERRAEREKQGFIEPPRGAVPKEVPLSQIEAIFGPVPKAPPPE